MNNQQAARSQRSLQLQKSKSRTDSAQERSQVSEVPQQAPKMGINEDVLSCEVAVETTDLEEAVVRQLVNLNVEELYKVVFRNGLDVGAFTQKPFDCYDNDGNNNELFMDIAQKVGRPCRESNGR